MLLYCCYNDTKKGATEIANGCPEKLNDYTKITVKFPRLRRLFSYVKFYDVPDDCSC